MHTDSESVEKHGPGLVWPDRRRLGALSDDVSGRQVREDDGREREVGWVLGDSFPCFPLLSGVH